MKAMVWRCTKSEMPEGNTGEAQGSFTRCPSLSSSQNSFKPKALKYRRPCSGHRGASIQPPQKETTRASTGQKQDVRNKQIIFKSKQTNKQIVAMSGTAVFSRMLNKKKSKRTWLWMYRNSFRPWIKLIKPRVHAAASSPAAAASWAAVPGEPMPTKPGTENVFGAASTARRVRWSNASQKPWSPPSDSTASGLLVST